MPITVKTVATDKLRSQCLILPVRGGQLDPTGSAIDARLDGALAAALKSGDLARKAGATLLLRGAGGLDRVLLVSVGDGDTVPENAFVDAVRAGVRAAAATGANEATSCLHAVPVTGREPGWRVARSVLVAHDALYRFDQYKSKAAKEPAPPALRELGLAVDRDGTGAARAAIAQATAIAEGVALAKDLGNTPGNVCQPTWLAAQARALARRGGLKCEVLDARQMAALKMGALLAVAQGSAQPPRMIVLQHRGGPSRQAPIVLVGKGITFDTGGISLKPAADMDEMKYDMCGAASVLGVMHAVSRMKLPRNVIGVIAAAENMPSGTATRPGDIVTTMSGQTVEILNTDAEGRLVLCDALTYVERFKPAAVIDIATLTGACVIALGHHHAGLFASDEALADRLGIAGRDAGDTCWRMPLDEPYQEGLRSPFADMANVGGRAGGAITAACYLSRFAKAYPWAHLDIAGVAWKSGTNKGATGRPVGLLTRYLMDLAD